MVGIYKITNKINGKSYIGQSVNITNRWHKEVYASQQPDNSGYNTHLSRAFRQYGIENFQFDVIEECDATLLNDREKYWADYYNTYVPNGYNVAICGEQFVHFVKLDQQMLNSIRDDLRCTADTLQVIANRYNVHYNTIVAINTGKSWFDSKLTYPLRTAKNIIEEKPVSIYPTRQELVLLLQQTQNQTQVGRMYGVTHTSVGKWIKKFNIQPDEWKQNKIVKTPKRKQKYPVLQIDLRTNTVVAEYESCAEAARQLGGNEGTANHISEVCQGKRKTCAGFAWQFKDVD